MSSANIESLESDDEEIKVEMKPRTETKSEW